MIRKIEEKDIEEVMNIWLHTNIQAHSFIAKQYWEKQKAEVKKAILKAEVFVFTQEENVVGFIGMVGEYIAGIFVKEEMQHRAIGTKLLQECKKRYSTLTLSVYEKNQQAIRFYQKEGFYVKEKRIDQQTQQREWVMEWTGNQNSISKEAK